MASRPRFSASLRADRLESAYLALPVGLRRAIPARVKLGLRNWLLPEWQSVRAGSDGAVRQVRDLEDRLWGGFSRSARAGLEAVQDGTGSKPKSVAQAAWTLARWHATRGDYAAALASIRRARDAHPHGADEKRMILPQAKFLCLLGQRQEARALLAAYTEANGFDSSVALMRAASHRGPGAGPADAEAALAEINAVYRHFGLAEIAQADPGRPLSIDNLAAAAPPVRSTGRVTVILPAYACEATVGTALAGLAAQSWEDLEVLVVDDASPDGTADAVADFARGDPRFRLIRQPANGGSYSCRNRALAEATGDFVTVHDSDDWSHPEKLRLQAEDMARGAPYNFTAWSRTLPDLTFLGTAQATRTLISLNFSSYMQRRSDIIAAGGWDHVRVTGDTELIWRIEALAGRRKTAFRDRLLLPACPLSFGRLSPDSLTGSEATHVLSIHHGVRREYREAADHWHDRLRRGEGRADLARLGVARFPCPPGLRPDRGKGADLDLLAVADFNMLGGSVQSALAMLRAGLRGGLSAGLLQYRRYDLDPTRALDAGIRDLAEAEGLRILAPGEAVRARTVLFTHPPLASHVMDRFPAIDHDHLVVVVNQMAERTLNGAEKVYDPAEVRANLAEMLGSEGVWAPISERVRAIMEADPRYPCPHEETWTPLIDLDLWTPRSATHDRRGRPVLGRHGRDHPLKWPVDAGALEAAYCAGRACEVRFLGGAKHARKRLGSWPANWSEEPYGAREVREFLAGLDVFLHYPDRDYIEEFGRAPMEAMAAGVPVILPPEFRPTFGPAALYAEPAEVWAQVAALWADRAAWTAQAAAGRAFVEAHCGYDALPRRLAQLGAAVSETAPAAEAAVAEV